MEGGVIVGRRGGKGGRRGMDEGMCEEDCVPSAAGARSDEWKVVGYVDGRYRAVASLHPALPLQPELLASGRADREK